MMEINLLILEGYWDYNAVNFKGESPGVIPLIFPMSSKFEQFIVFLTCIPAAGCVFSCRLCAQLQVMCSATGDVCSEYICLL